MKSEPKAFASLSSGLLARKGAARPAMRPQGFGQGATSLEDLGWNDMGFEPPKPAAAGLDAGHDAFGDEVAAFPPRPPLTGLTPIDSPVHEQQAEIAGRLAAHSPEDGAEEEDALDETAELHQPEVEEAPEPARAEPPLRLVAAPVQRYRATATRAAPGKTGKAAFTLRLDPERHLKLRLATAVRGQSAQMLVTQALDQLLAQMPELEAMAGKAKSRG